ncbi:MAG: citramalate synthase [Candidatus Sumerlaeota bacterium]|nr:citramalate synthase [Candidatus Sumerlaeota bacterium]
MTRVIELYDSTLRDGEQAEGISFTLEDKLRIARLLDDFGIHYIEGGWPGSNPKAVDFFKAARRLSLKHARLAAFGSTRRKGIKAEDDTNLRLLVDSHAPVTTIFGKTWDLHVTDALRASLDENLRMIADSVRFLKSKRRMVVYDAEHFFDGYKANPDYALKTLEAAAEAGAERIVLCDTNGGTMPTDIPAILEAVRKRVGAPLGIHTHNDAGMAVANAIMAVASGATHVQGTINGIGERTGNCDLVQVIPNLALKYGLKTVKESALRGLTTLAHQVAELANIVPDPRQPYVGRSNFAHKGGIHVSAIMRNPRCYEHVEPESVGNQRRVLVSDQSGKSNLVYKIAERGIEDFDADSPEALELLDRIKNLENEGYQFEAAEASVEVMLAKLLKRMKSRFQLHGWRVIVERRDNDKEPISEATVRLDVEGEHVHAAALGDGPVNALDRALRRALAAKHPEIAKVQLADYKVRIIDAEAGTAAKIRVLINSTDGQESWGTVGVSENIIEASWRALVDSLEYKMMKDEEKRRRSRRSGGKAANPRSKSS